jgi:hypothetical protein
MVYRFDEFELDPQTGELWGAARRIRLRPQPCAALVSCSSMRAVSSAARSSGRPCGLPERSWSSRAA